MKKLPFTEKELYDVYMDKINKICDDNEHKTIFNPEEIVSIIYRLIEKMNN